MTSDEDGRYRYNYYNWLVWSTVGYSIALKLNQNMRTIAAGVSTTSVVFFLAIADSCSSLLVSDRREFVSSSILSTLISSSLDNTAAVDDSRLFQDIQSELDSKNVRWNLPTTDDEASSIGVDWSQLRYGSSTLTGRARAPTPSSAPTHFPLEGHWLTTYRFQKASYPLGRDKLTLRVPGAGLGTCLALPNVGFNPSPFATHFTEGGYEDVAYNAPRRLEAFWPQAKVTSGQTARGTELSPKCLVTGEGCTTEENAQLHAPSTRLALEFSGPTRSGPSRTQGMDVTLLQCSSVQKRNEFVCSRSFCQFNIQQDLQTFYKEIISLDSSDPENVLGRIRVAAFLPSSESALTYDDSLALALYDYKVTLQSIDQEEAFRI
jgi:hypothetical protein